MDRLARDLAFWAAVGLAGVLVSGVLKALAARFRLPQGLEDWIAAAT